MFTFSSSSVLTFFWLVFPSTPLFYPRSQEQMFRGYCAENRDESVDIMLKQHAAHAEAQLHPSINGELFDRDAKGYCYTSVFMEEQARQYAEENATARTAWEWACEPVRGAHDAFVKTKILELFRPIRGDAEVDLALAKSQQRCHVSVTDALSASALPCLCARRQVFCQPFPSSAYIMQRTALSRR
jgi:hypothetical protein